MSILLKDCAGTVHVVSQGNGGGFYQIRPGLPETAEAKAILTGVALNFDEIFQPSVTLDDQRAIFSFGSAWSQMSVTGILLLGPDAAGGTIMSKFIDWYETNRLSTLNDSVSLSLTDKGQEVFIVGLALGVADAMFNRQEFSIKLLTSKDE